MKIRPLPATDIPRFATLSPIERRIALDKHGLFFPDTTLEPFRSTLYDICNVQSGFFESPQTDFKHIEAEIRRRCRKRPGSLDNCLKVARALWEFCQTHDVRSIERVVTPVPVGFGFSVRYWHDFYMIIDGEAVFPFFDPRLSNGLNSRAEAFVHSFMREYLLTGDYADARVATIRFGRAGEDRRAKIKYADERSAYTRQDLTALIEATYSDWIAICKSRPEPRKREDKNQTAFRGRDWDR